jgi:DNA polymerase-1
VIAQAMNEGIKITDNTKAKADAQRQVVNSRIQGSAADQSKLAMIALYNNERLKELGFRMLIPVHDEIIAECPKENAREVSELFAYVMSNSSGEKFTIPISCDVEVSDRWYGDSIDI